MTAPERLRVALARGVLLFRWAMVGFMFVVAVSGDEFRRPALAWTTLAVAAAWTLFLTLRAHRWEMPYLVADLGICVWLLVASALVVPAGDVGSGRPFFAQGYPVAAALMWGVSRGALPGLTAGSALALVLIASRPLNGVPLADLEMRQITSLGSAVLNYIVAPGVVGLVASLLADSSEAVERANRELVGERERAARLAERERLGRQIHDSVLQVLALIHKKARSLAAEPQVRGSSVAELSDLAADGEAQLRGLILREPDEPRYGRASLRTSLEEVARGVSGIDISVSAVGAIWLDQGCVDEIGAAVRQTLENVAEHADARRAVVFAEEELGTITVSVRDDGRGFVYDEDALRAAGKAGILKSMKGRIEDLGGRMNVTTSPGRGTEIEFVVEAAPHRTQESR